MILFAIIKIEKNIAAVSWIMFAMLYLAVFPANARNAEITNIIVRNVDGGLVIDMVLKGIFTKEVETAIHKGIPVKISFSVSLYEIKDLWFDKKLISIIADHRVQVDVLKKEYRIMRSWEQSGPRYEKDPQKARKILSDIIGLRVISLEDLHKGENYQLRVKSELTDRSYPLVGAPWEFKTDWYTINFIY